MQDGLHIFIRALGALTALFVMTRILGKKQISQLTFFEYATGITLGDLAGMISTDVERNFFHGIIALLVWGFVPYVLEMLSLKSKTLSTWLEGKPTIMIKEGHILEDNLKKERYTANELLERLRIKNVFKTSDVEFAMLETNGDLSVLLKRENQALTPKHLGMKLTNEKQSETVIMDGTIQDESLAAAGKSKGWLHTELDKLGVTKENVFLGQIDSYGELTVDLYDDKIKVPAQQQKPQLLAALKKCEADLELFSLTSKLADDKLMFEQCSEKLQKLLQELTPILKS